MKTGVEVDDASGWHDVCTASVARWLIVGRRPSNLIVCKGPTTSSPKYGRAHQTQRSAQRNIMSNKWTGHFVREFGHEESIMHEITSVTQIKCC